eukprot:TRINITY_DN7418_c0_g1_i1.p1 TRINITY_DN7418_c0_g1~~TRINITY_DN7418_c0_g1_i1.p1  ORF type:complete len:528 (-),score=126.57 TRINITY_DN7418_c0_g1_i1:116-1699(-)
MNATYLYEEENQSKITLGTPEHAPDWHLKIKFNPISSTPLYEAYNLMLSSFKEGYQWQIDNSARKDNVAFLHAMKSLTDSIATSLDSSNYLSTHQIDEALHELFEFSYDKSSFQNKILQLKSAPPGTLLSNFALMNLNLSSLKAIYAFWLEFAKELRYHWQKKIPLPGIPVTDQPDYNSCIIFQKLQLINFCIERHIERKQNQRLRMMVEKQEEMFSSAAVKRRGALEPVPGLFMLNTGLPIFRPLLQDHKYMTEDMIIEQENILKNTEFKAELQSNSVLSDMQAFKAANYDSAFEDFIRWYSPNDWEDNETGGILSKRMQDPDNLWQQMWKQAEPLSVEQQKPIFNYNLEGEKAMHFLETLPPAHLLEQLIAILTTTIIHNLTHCGGIFSFQSISKLTESMPSIFQRFSNDPVKAYSEFAGVLKKVEHLSSLATSLFHKFPKQARLVECFLGTDEDMISFDEERQSILSLLSSGKGKLPQPDFRKYVIKTVCSRPHFNSPPTPSRFFYSLSAQERIFAWALSSADV